MSPRTNLRHDTIKNSITNDLDGPLWKPRTGETMSQRPNLTPSNYFSYGFALPRYLLDVPLWKPRTGVTMSPRTNLRHDTIKNSITNDLDRPLWKPRTGETMSPRLNLVPE